MTTEEELMKRTQQLLDSIASGDWETYCRLCDPSMTCFEPEALGNLVHGLAFHQYYFELPRDKQTLAQTTISNPHVRIMNECAVVSYVRLIQTQNDQGQAKSLAFEETRVWQKTQDGWKHVHFHRSAPNS